ncbi:hypothetical protein ACCO45_011365 [Purpureocillium lilacinum]|uniref:Uncharacterized protein n=1 Tax=Purpureocillium lilacinum TaxID=33203 RepID=A0ACC4DIW8_PURLI
MMATNTSSQPVCQNCTTSTTPLWRRDEFGSVLCNACGLFLKLHGRPRPISLKTDVIKSRNRVKTIRPDLASKKKVRQSSPFPQPWMCDTRVTCANITIAAATTATATECRDCRTSDTTIGAEECEWHRRRLRLPVSRTGTPSMYNQGLPSFMVDDPYQTGFNGSTGADGGAGSPMNGDRSLDTPQTHEQLIAHNSSLKTRVSELEVINELFRGRLSQLEQQEAAARRGQEVAGAEQTQLRSQLEAVQESESQLRAQLEDSHRRENSLKRRLDELELELKEAQDAAATQSDRPAKRPRLQDLAEELDDVPISEELVPAPVAEDEAAPTTEPEAAAPEPEAALEPELSPAPEAEVPQEPEVEPETEAVSETPAEP